LRNVAVTGPYFHDGRERIERSGGNDGQGSTRQKARRRRDQPNRHLPQDADRRI
jgi:hypothetical protein